VQRDVGDDRALVRARGEVACLERRRLDAVDRTFDLEELHNQVAVAILRVGVVGLVVIVDERRRDVADAARHARVHGVRLRSRGNRLHVDARDLLAVDAQRHARRIGPGLLAVRASTEHVLAVAREAVLHPHLAGREQHVLVAAQHASLRALELLRAEVRARRMPGVLDDDRARGDAVRHREILLHQDVGHREHVADVVESVADVIGRELARRVVVDADEIADRVLVLAAVEPAQRHAAGIDGASAGRARGRSAHARGGVLVAGEVGVDPRAHRVDFGTPRTRALRARRQHRRHLGAHQRPRDSTPSRAALPRPALRRHRRAPCAPPRSRRTLCRRAAESPRDRASSSARGRARRASRTRRRPRAEERCARSRPKASTPGRSRTQA
jgi:hypothetical protein